MIITNNTRTTKSNMQKVTSQIQLDVLPGQIFLIYDLERTIQQHNLRNSLVDYLLRTSDANFDSYRAGM